MTTRAVPFSVMPIMIDQHYPPVFYAALWAVSESTIVRWFRDMPGVLKLVTEGKSGKRGRVELRIPFSLAMEKYASLTK